MTREPPITYNDDDTWTLDAEFSVQSRGYSLVVPQGFVTDLASIPRPFWSEIAPFELSIGAVVLHDWLYQHGGRILCRNVPLPNGGQIAAAPLTFTRADADAFLRDIAAQFGVSLWRRNAAYYAVRLFGGRCWVSA